MATLLKGLAAFKAEKERIEQEREARNRPRANYLDWKKNKNKEDKNVLYIRFLQEVDKDIPGYNEDRGLPIVSVEHQAPGKQGYLRRANCTKETEGQCYACERHAEDRAEMKQEGRDKPKGWGPKRNFYTWVLVDYNDGDGVQPVVLSRSFGSTFYDDLVTEVTDDPDNQITNKMWRLTKSGSSTKTVWKLKQMPSMELYDDTDVEVPDLEASVLRAIPYEDQAAYYGAVYKEGDPLDDDDSAAPATKATPVTEDKEFTW